MTDLTPADRDARDQTASDRDQTASDRDQTSSDQDQTFADLDQSLSDSDQRSSDDDQHAADDDLAGGSDRETYDRTTTARAMATDDREAVSQHRTTAGDGRGRTAHQRDRAAAERDSVAEERDAAAHARDLAKDTGASWQQILLRARYDRERAAVDRERAADDRAQASADRTEAARERTESLRVRTESENLLEAAATDKMTGARTRYLGLDEAARELTRARRTGVALTVAFLDVNGLASLNDTHGDSAGDALLLLVGQTLRANLRARDVIVRYGGDEFVCAMPNLSADAARACFEGIGVALADVHPTHSVSFGLAEAGPTEDLEQLIARAAVDLRDAQARDE